jgi:hypothetical protein
VSRARLVSALACIVLAACIAQGISHAAQPGPALAALRVASLTERALKLQAQAGQSILADRSHRALAQTVRDLDAAVRGVGVPASPAELHESAAILRLLVADYRAWALKAPTRDNARKLGERAEEIAWEAAKVARLLGEAGEPAHALAAKAADASALSQRIARLLLWQRWGIASSSGVNELALAKAALRADLDALRAAPATTSEIESELQVAENQAAFLFAAAYRLASGAEGARQVDFVAKASDNMHESLERLVSLYAARAR